jgi:hypothetical protein
MAGNIPFLTIIVFVTANDHMIVGSIYNYLSITHSITFLLITSTFTHCHTSLPIKQAPYIGAMLCGKSSR